MLFSNADQNQDLPSSNIEQSKFTSFSSIPLNIEWSRRLGLVRLLHRVSLARESSQVVEYLGRQEAPAIGLCLKLTVRHSSFPQKALKLNRVPEHLDDTATASFLCQSSLHYYDWEIIFFICPIAFAGFNPFGHALVQFMIVWQRYNLNVSFSCSSRSSVAMSRLSTIQRYACRSAAGPRYRSLFHQ